MSSCEWTPGPWIINREPKRPLIARVGHRFVRIDETVSDARPSIHTILPDAYLIAASPELYEALDKLVLAYRLLGGLEVAYDSALVKAEEAMKKARGEQDESSSLD